MSKINVSGGISDSIGNSHYPAAALWEKLGNAYD